MVEYSQIAFLRQIDNVFLFFSAIFPEMGIESPLMQDSEGKPFDKFYELPNGCICCTAK